MPDGASILGCDTDTASESEDEDVLSNNPRYSPPDDPGGYAV